MSLTDRKDGYKRSYGGFKRTVAKLKEQKPKRKKYYQYTAVDECSRWTFREMYDEHSTYSSKDFLMKLIEKAPFPIREIQTDNGAEFTNCLIVTKSKHLTLFEDALLELFIIGYK